MLLETRSACTSIFHLVDCFLYFWEGSHHPLHSWTQPENQWCFVLKHLIHLGIALLSVVKSVWWICHSSAPLMKTCWSLSWSRTKAGDTLYQARNEGTNALRKKVYVTSASLKTLLNSIFCCSASLHTSFCKQKWKQQDWNLVSILAVSVPVRCLLV